ncbi:MULTISPECIES: class I SAM-dependent methyltransferase [unclassified Streptomyces]|jgi:tRNA (cmo5U34)-methyltransferase|uniref:class I SAM-dependent methyltransferase n=1 Tax=unclassified Streptomyces TaxID=2593676 RepID=UPI003334036E
MTSTAGKNEIWNSGTFDSMRRKLIPSFDLIYSTGVYAVVETVPSRARVLDLGAGTGLLGGAILERLPEAELVLVDHSDAMLAKARERFAGNPRVTIEVADMKDPLPQGPFDAVVSGLAIHHLTHAEKEDLFRRIHEVLTPDGVFVNVEQLAGPNARIEAMYDAQHEAHVQRSECPPDEWAAGRERMKLDICATTEMQLEWLRKVGFSQVDILAKDWRYGTYAAWKAA